MNGRTRARPMTVVVWSTMCSLPSADAMYSSLGRTLPRAVFVGLYHGGPSAPTLDYPAAAFLHSAAFRGSGPCSDSIVPGASSSFGLSGVSTFLRGSFINVRPSLERMPPANPTSVEIASAPLFTTGGTISCPPKPTPVVVGFVTGCSFDSSLRVPVHRC